MVEMRTPILPVGVSAKIIAINCAVGERVEAEQCLFEIETDKVILDVFVHEDGVVHSIEVAIGDHVAHEQLLGMIDTDEDTYLEDLEHLQVQMKPRAAKQSEGINAPTGKSEKRASSPKGLVNKRDKWIVVACILFIVLCLLVFF